MGSFYFPKSLQAILSNHLCGCSLVPIGSYHYYKGYAARKVGTEVHAFDVETYLIEALQEMVRAPIIRCSSIS
jgi:hypothetical protein